MLEQIKTMHKKFGVDFESQPDFTEEERRFRIAAMLEEIGEYVSANTKEEELDALVDLTVFTLGTAERMGFGEVFLTAFKRVMHSNMSKEVGPNNKRGGFRLDLRKGLNWEAAELNDLVNE